jgi:hypothetical protein
MFPAPAEPEPDRPAPDESFCSRLTPVVSQLDWEEYRPSNPGRLSLSQSDALEAERQSLSNDATGAEAHFWLEPVVYSEPPPASLSAPPKARPSTLRKLGARFLFTAMLIPVLMLFAHTLFLQFGITWLDMRVAIAAAGELLQF